jgi:hypothetical protein
MYYVLANKADLNFFRVFQLDIFSPVGDLCGRGSYLQIFRLYIFSRVAFFSANTTAVFANFADSNFSRDSDSQYFCKYDCRICKIADLVGQLSQENEVRDFALYTQHLHLLFLHVTGPGCRVWSWRPRVLHGAVELVHVPA